MLKMPAFFLCSLLSLFVLSAHAEQETTTNNWTYHRMQPAIVTNYISSGRRLGYVKTSVELMVNAGPDLALVELHDPLLRDAIIEIFGQQTEDEVRAIDGKERIRQLCLVRVNDLLVQETGKKLVNDLLFTTYFYE
ncbi:flagellar basal body-associated protein FliL [Alginatibacterium sediminis]|uniref:Flagellar protein FliL n=1 Tax=Alginatibacterium sediminis TaxID=2164068 RepID=A0A420E684_9ALTE|nr:flagellar basal body-associated protein FliL [Alginatibacterium sediminis]RKF13167.1 flagellar basal body-associated protein FliL [Alginatibacterium sediminis]